MRLSLVVAVALLAACAPLPTGLAGTPAPSPLERFGGSGEMAMFLTDSYNGSGLIPIDHLTLQDRSTKPQLPLYPSSGNNSSMVASQDGSTVAVMNYWYRDPVVPQGLEIGIYDAPNGLLRARFNPEVPVIVDGLSPDGSRIYARAWPPRESTAERLVLDTVTGAVLAREPKFSWRGEGFATVRDERTRRVYALLAPTDPKATGPQPLELGGWDLRTGRELWRISVPSLSGGRWPTDRIIDGRAVYSSLTPGLAIGNDGSRLAVVGAFGGATGTVWLIDSERGEVIFQRAYGRTSFSSGPSRRRSPRQGRGTSL